MQCFSNIHQEEKLWRCSWVYLCWFIVLDKGSERTNLKQNNTGLKNQLGKLTDQPTRPWIFQGFQGIHVVVLNGVKQIVNLTDSRVETLNYFSQYCQKYYILSG